MNRQSLNTLIRQAAEVEHAIMAQKGPLYSSDINAFDNFERIASKLNSTREQVLWVYLLKHLLALESAISSNSLDDISIPFRIHDCRNYLGILYAMIKQPSL